MDIKETIELIEFFNKISVDIKDVTNPQELHDGQKVVEATYTYENKNYTTKKLYYKNISQTDDVKNPEEIEEYFGSPVFWLDIEKHKWPKDSEENPSMEKDVFPDITDDADFLMLIKEIYEKILSISQEGRSPRYYVNLDNNNHLHDILLLIKEYINSKGNPIDKDWFSKLVFKWDKKNDILKRVSLHPNFGYRTFISPNLETNIKNAFKEIDKMKEFQNYLKLLETRKQIILQGPPGTSKTYQAKRIAAHIILKDTPNIDINEEVDKEEKNEASAFADLKFKSDGNGKYEGQWSIIQFHPSYNYEDFVRGIQISTGEQSKQPEYNTVNRIFAEMADAAQKEKERAKSANDDNVKKFVLIIDEINRANVAAVLGELIYGLEYRGASIEIPYKIGDTKSLIVPDNLYVIGTMNTADRSIGHIDYAVRRRFAFVSLLPEKKIIEAYYEQRQNTIPNDVKEKVVGQDGIWTLVDDLFKKKPFLGTLMRRTSKLVILIFWHRMKRS